MKVTHTHTTCFKALSSTPSLALLCRRILQGNYKTITKRDFVQFRDSDGRGPFPGQVHDMTSGFAKNLPQTMPRSKEVRALECGRVNICKPIEPLSLLFDTLFIAAFTINIKPPLTLQISLYSECLLCRSFTFLKTFPMAI